MEILTESLSSIGKRPVRCKMAEVVRQVVVAASLVLTVAVLCTAQSDEQSLGKVAREHKPARKAARVITNDEIPSVRIPDSSPTAGQPSSDPTSAVVASNSAPADATRDKPSAQPPRDLKKGINVPGVLANGTVEQAKAMLESLKHDRQALEANYDKVERQMGSTDSDALRRVYAESLSRRDESLDKNQKSIDALESAIKQAQDRDAQGENR